MFERISPLYCDLAFATNRFDRRWPTFVAGWQFLDACTRVQIRPLPLREVIRGNRTSCPRSCFFLSMRHPGRHLLAAAGHLVSGDRLNGLVALADVHIKEITWNSPSSVGAKPSMTSVVM